MSIKGLISESYNQELKKMISEKSKIVFRVDAGNIVGTGHLIEVVSLIKSLRKRIDFHAIAIVNEHPLCYENIRPLVEHIEVIPDKIVGNNELDILIPFLKNKGISILVTDLLNRSIEYYQKLKNNIAKTFVILDNDIHAEIPATVVVNFNITQPPEFYKKLNAYDTEYLIGTPYIPLDEDLFVTYSKKIVFREEVKKIFVNQGGGDPYGLTAKTLRALEKLKLEQEIIVVIGGALTENHRQELESLKPILKGNYKLYENIPQQKMYELLSESDIALTAAGNTLYELAFFGVPSIVIGHHKTHNKVASVFQEKDAVINLGIGVQIDEDEVIKAIKSLLHDVNRRKTLSANARLIVDGYGIGRLCDMLIRYIKGVMH